MIFKKSYLRLTVPYGIPVEELNAGKSLLAASSANLKRGPLQGHPGSKSIPDLWLSKCALSNPNEYYVRFCGRTKIINLCIDLPPTIRMLVSKTDTLMSESKLFSLKTSTTRLNSV